MTPTDHYLLPDTPLVWLNKRRVSLGSGGIGESDNEEEILVTVEYGCVITVW